MIFKIVGDKMKKIIVIIICLFIFSGCDVTYNLDTTNYFQEDIDICDYYSRNDNPIVLNNKLEKIHMMANDILYLRNNSFTGVYDVSKYDDGQKFGLSLIGKFGDNNSNSNAVRQACNNYTVNEISNDIELSANGFKLFEREDVDTLTINIKAKNVKESNADRIVGDVFTWIITRDDYEYRDIRIVFEKNKKVVINKDNSMIGFYILLVFLFIIGIFVYYKINNKRDSVNNF